VKIRVYRTDRSIKVPSSVRDLNTTAMPTAAGTEVRVKGFRRDLMHLKQYRDGCGSDRIRELVSDGPKRQNNDVRQ